LNNALNNGGNVNNANNNVNQYPNSDIGIQRNDNPNNANNNANNNATNNLPKINKKAKDEDIIKEFFNEGKREETKESYIPKIDPSKKPKWCLTKEEAEEINDKEDEKLIEFAQNLDYDKYMKDMEVREALYLIKSKIEAGDENHDFKVEGREGEENKEGERAEEVVNRSVETDPVEKLKNELISKKVEHDNDWNSSVRLLY